MTRASKEAMSNVDRRRHQNTLRARGWGCSWCGALNEADTDVCECSVTKHGSNATLDALARALDGVP